MAEDLKNEEVVETEEEVETDVEVEEEVETEEEVDTGDSVETDEEDETGDDADTEESKTFSQEEVNELIKSRLGRKDEEFNKKLDKLVSEKLAEEKRQSQLTEEQKEAERLSKLKEELEEKQRELDFKARFSEAETGLRKVNLDPRFARWLVNEDKETTESNIKEFQTLFDKAVEARSIDKLKGKTPKSNRKPKKKGITKEEFSNMGYRDRQQLKLKDPDLYEELSKL